VGERVLAGGKKLRGLYAMRAAKPGDPVASFHGRLISRAELAKLFEADRPTFELVNEYAIAPPSSAPQGVTPSEMVHFYPHDIADVGAHLINHSCDPNCRWGSWERGAVLVRALRSIAEGEELTAFYGWLGLKGAMAGGHYACACTARFCVGTIELGVEFLREDEANTGGPYLPLAEVARRFFADIVNGTDCHEGLMRRYARDGHSMMVGAKVTIPIDEGAFAAKLAEGARQAIRRAHLRYSSFGPQSLSEKRLGEVSRRYEAPRAY
jgi:hypothetical protein